MKMCKKCSTCIGNTICEILTYPNNGQCDIFIKLVEEKLKSPNKQSTPLPIDPALVFAEAETRPPKE